MTSPTPPILAAIYARSRNGVIGREGDLPWRLRSDLRQFMRTTMGKPCLMGRKTWDSLRGPLPGRPNLVLSRDPDFRAEGAEAFTDLFDIVGRGAELAGSLGTDEVMVIGGAQIYRALMPWTQRVYETEVQTDIEGDAYMPALDPKEWVICDRTHHAAGPGDDHDFVTSRAERRLTADQS